MNSKDTLNNLRKKVFILAGYVIVAGLLFVYVSYSQYSIMVKGDILMPQTYTMNASMGMGFTEDEEYIDETMSEDEARTFTKKYTQITGLMDSVGPGDNAVSYATGVSVDPSEPTHSFNIEIKNWEELNGTTYVSPLDMEYKLFVETEGILPLQFVIEKNGVTYSAVTTRSLTHSAVQFKDNHGNAFSSTLGGVRNVTDEMLEASKQSNTHTIYVGWNNGDTSPDSQSIVLSKEVDKITIRADITGQKVGSFDFDAAAPEVTEDKVYKITEAAITAPEAVSGGGITSGGGIE